MTSVPSRHPVGTDPATEISFMIRSAGDALRLVETLRYFCIEHEDHEGLQMANKLLSLVRGWNASVPQAAWEEICQLCADLTDVALMHGYYEEAGFYIVAASALRYYSERECSATFPIQAADESRKLVRTFRNMVKRSQK